MKICFFTVANGENYSHIANTLAYTFKRHSNYTLEVFTDFQENVKFGNSHPLGDFNHNNYMFKFDFFKKIYEIVNADYYVYIDSDSFIVKNFDGIEDVISKNVFHVFLENELLSDRLNWHGKNLEIINLVFNEISKKNIQYYNLNGGFFSIKRDHIHEIVNRAYEVQTVLKNKLTNNFTEEYVLSFLAGEYMSDVNPHLLNNNLNYYAIDTQNHFSNKIPKNKNWQYKEWFSDRTYEINPAIIHCPNNKNLFIKFSKELLSTEISPEKKYSKNPNIDFNFIIACSRPYNLPFVIRSIEKQCFNINYKIWLVFDFNENEIDDSIVNFIKNKPNIIHFFQKNANNKSNGGNAAKNFALNQITYGWVYQLDDDNLLYPNFVSTLVEYIKNNPSIECFIFSQNNRYYPKNGGDIRCGVTDTAMYLVNKSFIENDIIPEVYGGDGQFIEKLYNKNPEKCFIIDAVLCYYNILEKLN